MISAVYEVTNQFLLELYKSLANLPTFNIFGMLNKQHYRAPEEHLNYQLLPSPLLTKLPFYKNVQLLRTPNN